jgi:phosphoribosylglycinamide formyltransferase 1
MGSSPRTPPIHDPPIRLAVCVSGGGTTLQNLIELIRTRRLNAQIVQVVASRPRIGAIPRAEAAGIPLALANRTAQSTAEFSASVFDPIRRGNADLVILGGFLALVKIPPDYKGRVINIHPSLIPAFCGKGFYGHRVHEAVLAAGVKLTGATVHFVDAEYDHGPIVLQEAVPVLPGDDEGSLHERIKEVEHRLFPLAARLLAESKLKIEDRRVHILDDR